VQKRVNPSEQIPDNQFPICTPGSGTQHFLTVKTFKDKQTVTRQGQPIQQLIDGVKIRELSTLMDYRGQLTEIWNPDWAFAAGDVPYAYHVEAAPGSIRAWVVHYKQEDRLHFPTGRLQVVLFDGREASPTYRMVNECYFGTDRRALLLIPPGVFHGVLVHQHAGSALRS
jgi:dTDP-4-dehydrorhamnose 3,5-epimerase